MAETLSKILDSHVAHGASAKDKVLGAAFIVVNKDGILYEHAAGRTRIALNSPPFTTHSITWLASMTKLLTATSLMHLVSSGAVTLDADVRPLVPELAAIPILRGFEDSPDDSGAPILVPNTHPITLRQLLTHTAGMGVDVADPALQRWSRHVGRTANLASCTLEGWSAPLKFAPGTGWYYGTGPDWAGVVLERVVGGGKTLGEYMRDTMFEPLGMDGTGFFRGRLLAEGGGEEKDARWVPLVEREMESGEFREGRVPWPEVPELESAAGGLYSCAADYAKVVQALVKALAGEDGGSVVGTESAREMVRGQLDEKQRAELQEIAFAYGSAAEIAPGTPLDHGIGGMLTLADVEGKRKKGSFMWSGYCNSRWWIDPETGIGGVLFMNVTPYCDPTAVKLLDELERAVYSELVPHWKGASS